MAPKTINVIDASGIEHVETVGSDEGLDKKLRRYGVACFVHSMAGNVDDFDSLVHGSTYTLGPPVQAAPAQVSQNL